jgi:ankyrin repeat protein
VAEANSLPARPNLDFLKKLAKRQVAADRKIGKTTSLALAQLAIARQYGFASWTKLKAHITEAPALINMPRVFRDVMKAIVRRNNEQLIQLLQKAPEVVNQTGPHPEWGGRPQPLHVAIETGNVFAFKTLLDAGANIDGNNETYDRWSPLMLAIHWKRNAMRDELIHRGARIDLLAALMMKDDRRAAKLLKDPSALKGPFANNATPLHFARTLKSAQLLLARGIDPTAKNKYGNTAAEIWAKAKPRSAGLMRLAKSLGAQNQVNIFQAVEQGRLTATRKMLGKSADPNSRFATGSKHTLLHAAAWNGDLAMAKLLVSRGADVHAVDQEHKTTPARWARIALQVHERKTCGPVAEYLESLMTTSKTSARR